MHKQDKLKCNLRGNKRGTTSKYKVETQTYNEFRSLNATSLCENGKYIVKGKEMKMFTKNEEGTIDQWLKTLQI